MAALEAREALAMWPSMAPVVFVPHSEAEYLHIVALLDQLIDEVGEEESHQLGSLIEVLGVLVEAYESEHVPEL